MKKASRRRRGRKQVIYGAIALIIGLAITLGSLMFAEGGYTSGYFIIGWGPILYGVIQLLRGLVNLTRSAF
jgi:predicted phage tail protein